MTGILVLLPLPSDGTVLVAMHVALLCFLVYSLAAEFIARLRAGSVWLHARSATASLTVTRGEKSMAMLAGIFAAAVGVYALAIEVSDVLVGHKSVLVVCDFGVLAYLCFFNNWFRNALIGTAMERHKESR